MVSGLTDWLELGRMVSALAPPVIVSPDDDNRHHGDNRDQQHRADLQPRRDFVHTTSVTASTPADKEAGCPTVVGG